MELGRAAIDELVARCRDETEKFLRRESADDGFCHELFRRAIAERAHAAWDAVFAQYRGMVLAWVRRHPLAATTHEDDDYWVNRTFDRFWGAVTPERFVTFTGMAALLRYLKLCAHSVLMDEARARRAARTEPFTDAVAETSAGPDIAGAVADELAGGALWEVVAALMQDDAERRVAYSCFVLDLKPREVFARYGGEFASVDDVYRIKRNLLERLRRHPDVRAFLGEL